MFQNSFVDMFLYNSSQCCIIEACGDGILWYNKVYIYAKKQRHFWNFISAQLSRENNKYLIGVPRTICSLNNPMYWLQKICFLAMLYYFFLYFFTFILVKTLWLGLSEQLFHQITDWEEVCIAISCPWCFGRTFYEILRWVQSNACYLAPITSCICTEVSSSSRNFPGMI